MALVIDGIARCEQRVQLGERPDSGDGHQVTAAEPADLALDPALLMAALDPGQAIEAVEAVVGAQPDEPFVLQPVPTQQDLDDRGLQVVVADQRRDATEMLEGEHVALEERLLGLMAERHMEPTARTAQAQAEHPALHQGPGDPGHELPEIALGFLAGAVALGHRHGP